jgi:3-dehydro-L-gulonate 2-dehydrogenase
MAIPSAEGPVLVDMAMSQFANGKLEVAKQKGESLPMPCGWDESGNLTNDPETVLKTKRLLQTGYWKGSAFAMAMDMACIVSSLGMSTPKIDEIIKTKGVETGHSQIFIAINCAAVADPQTADRLLKEAEMAYLASEPDGSGTPIHIPGRLISEKHAQAEADGVPVLEATWKKILELAEAES